MQCTETKQCGACGGRNMAQDTRDREFAYKGELITIRRVPGWYCPDCGESEPVGREDADSFSRQVEEAIQAADLRQRQEVRSIRKRLGLKQAEAAEIFGGGVNAFSEYERGVRKPAKSTVLLLRLLDRHPHLLPEVREARRRGKQVAID
ncbi:MAG: type II TA system antitoxin MqsA family protein [Desulfobulbus sp.]|jgi:HTH-type transcriptional regulator/antitoxin MqsA